MVAYSFKRQFIEPISSGAKTQTIRAERRRHAFPGETLQLYAGMRTRHCRLIGTATCADVLPVRLCFDDANPAGEQVRAGAFSGSLDEFARADGFASWVEMKAFWRANHPGIDRFDGVLIRWEDFVLARQV